MARPRIEEERLRKIRGFRFTDETHRRLNTVAQERGLTMTAVLESLINSTYYDSSLLDLILQEIEPRRSNGH